MTKVYLQPGLRGMSGGMGDWVYKFRKGKTIVGMKPVRTAEPTEAQLAHQANFKTAVAFAKSALANPTLLTFYRPIAVERKLSTYALVIADCLSAPSVDSMDTEGYTGNV